MMDGPDGFPVFFHCPSLDEEQRRRIENYFHIRRKSGGGECSSVMEVGDKVYRVAFKERQAQQRVLQKTEHVLEFPDGNLVLSVRDNPGSSKSSDKTAPTPEKITNPKQDLTSAQNPGSSLFSNLPPSGEKYELQLDPYVFRYLTEFPKAKTELETNLATMSCSAHFHPEEDTVLVRQLAQLSAAAGGVSNWKSEVDKLFDSYTSHYELDSHKIKALLLSRSSQQSADEVKVYSEIGAAVVVGKRSQVKARLTDFESTSVKHRRSTSGESKSTIYRIGEAKLSLLWKDIESSLGRNLPEVKATQADEGKLLLEGSVEDILKAREVITEKEKLVFKKTISDKTPYFLSFLKQVYGSPRMLCDVLGVGDKVEVELQDTVLNFFSHNADKLNESEKMMEKKFKEVKYDVPNCSVVPSELREKLKSKTNEMNQKECRAKVVFGADNTVGLLGHTKEVDELSDAVTEFILDQSSVEGKVLLPFPELVQLLPELLQLHNFDLSGVTFSPVTASSKPTVVLEGSANKVTEVRNRLGPFLDSIVQDNVTLDLAGAARFFECHSGRQSLLQVAQANKCLIQLEEQPHISRQNLDIVKYNLQHGLQVMVCEGDITKQYADALVNAANEDLNHTGGVAAALSKAGGPQVQRESHRIVKQTGKIPTGEVVVTTGGNLKCKKLLHAVGPVGGNDGGRERITLEKTVHNVLNLAEMMEFKSVAMPCISSGVFGVPIRVCSDAIVTAIKEFGSQCGRSLSNIMLIDNRAEVVRAMQEACDRLLQEKGSNKGPPGDVRFKMNEGATAGATENTVQVKIIQGIIETQQADAIVSPMVGLNPASTNVGQALASVVGPELTAKFQKEAGGATQAGELVVVENLPGLKCKIVVFLNLNRWDNAQDGNSVQELRQGIRKILSSCEIRGFSSVAFPVLGTGALLAFPHMLASSVLLEEVRAFEQNRIHKTLFLVYIVVHPKDKESSKAFQSAQGALHLKGLTNDVNPNQASFYRHVSGSNDEVTALLGGVKLEMVCGDITKAGTDVIVNTTGFLNQHSGVSKAILTAAGSSVQAELAKAGVPADLMCTTGPGLLGCKEIIHADFKGDLQLTRKTCKKILLQCESKGFSSVAFPAINTGQAGVRNDEACKAMLDGMVSAITESKPKSLSLIRIVILQQPVFQAFRSELEVRFGQIVQRGLKENALLKLKNLRDKCSSRFSTAFASQGQSFISSKPQPAVLRVISCGQDINKSIKTDLEGLLKKELLERSVNMDEFSKLNEMEMSAVLAKVKLAGISMEHKKHQSSEAVNRSGRRAHSGSGKDVYVLKGLTEDVLSVIELISKAVHKALEEDLRDKEEAMMALTVEWAMKDDSGEWQELSLHHNYILENAYQTKQVFVDLETPGATVMKVNLRTLEATEWSTGKTYKLKRNESKKDLELPQHWEPMNGEYFKKVELQRNSSEYKRVSDEFLKTAKYKILKIERIQNFYLWQAFSVCRQRIAAKNGLAELGEKFLYHGTSAESCNCIEKDRFDRSYSGTHAAVYGKGVYFAVNANYSADRFSPADTSGLKRLYVARVLTGRYTVGKSSMIAPPPRGSDPTDCFNSLVDNAQNPSMFVIFHDDQAYPEYLITFS